jgi:hypothetical protein
MSTDPTPDPASRLPAGGNDPATVAYRLAVLLLLGLCAGFLGRIPFNPPASTA